MPKTSEDYLSYLMTILGDDTLSNKEKEMIKYVIDIIILENKK